MTLPSRLKIVRNDLKEAVSTLQGMESYLHFYIYSHRPLPHISLKAGFSDYFLTCQQAISP